VQCDFEAAAAGEYLALYDASVPTDVLEQASRDGRVLLVHIKDDCEAHIRVFVDEDPPAELLAAAHRRRLTDASLSLPSGRLLATGAEAIGASVPAGAYRVSAFHTFHWKVRNRAKHVARATSGMGRVLLGAETAIGVGAAMFLVGNFLALPGLGALALKHGGSWPLRALLWLLAVDAVFYAVVLGFHALARWSPLYRAAREAREQFERAFPDVVVQLTSGAAPGSPGEAVLVVP
jgi:hypothetical protein